ncbi:hypothetical protein niasHT_019276 [Heterodera trifolii]|uniref:Integrase catalytic domain-containing protein n=1 Tax=Heterodera trifolii TaxID=157864 RepID=A0ABD2L2R8_9BILA
MVVGRRVNQSATDGVGGVMLLGRTGLESGSKYIPWKVLTDQGKEFTARAVQQFFRTNGVVQEIVRAINHSPNSTIGMCPADVNFKNAEALRQKLHNAAENVVRRQPRYRVGDRVRIEKYKHVFKKGYLPRFTNELFTVAEVHPERSPVVYRLRDDHNEIISGWFYANDLCKTLEDKQQKMYEIEKILKKKRQNGTVEQQFVQIEWQTGNTVRIEVPPSNVTNPHELSKNLYRLLGDGSDPLAKKVRSTQNYFMLTINKARRWAREEYIKRKTKEKRGVRDEEMLLQAMLTDTGILVELNSVDHGLLAREKRAETSNIALRTPADDDDSYQQKLDEYFSKLTTKEMGTEAWIQAYREIRLVCQFNYDVHRNRFVLNTDPRYVKKVAISPQLAYILGFNNTEFMQPVKEARFVPDMSGGVSSFHVYTPDLIEPMMIGDVTAPVLRIVTIRGNRDQVVEEQFFAIQYHKLLSKEISEIFIEIPDQIPAGAIVKFPHCMVVNLDPSTSHGSHWVGIYCASPLHLEYYDSLGLWPPPSVHISANSSACGRHVIFFLYCRCVGKTFEKIVRFLHYGKVQPDALRGAGVGAVFRSLMRYLLPIGKQIGSAIGRQGMESGNRVLTNVLEGKDLKESKAYITNELSFPINAKKNFLGSTGYYHTVNQDDSTDEGFKERCKIFKGGKNAQFLSRLDFDLGNQELYLLNNLDLLFTIYKAKDVFLLQTLKANDATKYRLTVHDVKIYAKMVEVQPSLNMSLYKTLEKQPATYAVRKTEIKSSFISVGRYEFEYNVFSATIPRRVTIALVGNSAFHGDYKLSTFMFEPFDLREISIHAGGDHFVSAFVDMYEALGMANSERSFDISMAQFKKGWSFFVIPLTSTLDDSCGFELLRSGTTNVRATFNSPIPLGGVEMIVFGEFDQMIMVDYNRHIVTDSKLG